MTPTTTIQALVDEFIDSTIKQYEAAFDHNDPELGNRYADRRVRAFQKLRSFGDAGREALMPALSHEYKAVRVMAAAFLLRYRTEEAMAVLKREAQGTGIPSFGASECLKRWAEGAWELDPPD